MRAESNHAKNKKRPRKEVTATKKEGEEEDSIAPFVFLAPSVDATFGYGYWLL
jgi:hypothetical protein